MLSNDELVQAVYEGDLAKIKADFSKTEGDSPSGLLLDVTSLLKAGAGQQYKMDFVSLICKAEAEHPHHFDQYKALLSFLIEKDGLKKVVDLASYPTFYCQIDNKTSPYCGKKYRVRIPMSSDMKTHLQYLALCTTDQKGTNEEGRFATELARLSLHKKRAFNR